MTSRETPAAVRVAEPFDPDCRRCARLADALCAVRRAHPDYHARPVPPFGTRRPELLIVGLAPGLHGANRTGRPFTGDGAGLPLYRTLHALGLASRAESIDADDGLRLKRCAITNAVRCWPPANRPLPDETRRCNSYLRFDLDRVPRGGVFLALGAIAHGAVLHALALRPVQYPFSHGAEFALTADRWLLDSYHCSRYNMNTGRLTEPALRAVFERALELLELPLGTPTPMTEPGAKPFDAREFVKTLPGRPGVYRMLDAAGAIIYVGKARNLKNRVGSYFHARNVVPKVQAMVSQVAGIDVTLANSDTEALLLEYNLIKQHKPRYNVVLRDDKSFPSVHVTTDADFPRLAFYRGPQNRPGRYFGPYPSAGAVRETLQQLQKLFKLRNCEDTFFANRSRPCLQHQIERCSAPCVGLITREDYARDVASAVKVLEGRSEEVNEELARRMDVAAGQLEFETAARLRDQLAALKKVQAQQIVNAATTRDVDVVALAGEAGEHCVAVMFVRGGRNLGTTQFFPRAPIGEAGEIMAAFLTQYYFAHEVPPDIVLNTPIEDSETLAATLAERAGRRVRVRHAVRGLARRWSQMTQTNAAQALRMRLANRAGVELNLEAVREALRMPEAPQRIECFDISHTRGEGTVASCVVFGREGPIKTDYRRFNISGIEPGDDYGAMRQALTRRYKRVKAGEIPMPDLLLIDGGKGQLTQALEVLKELDLPGLAVAGVAKGADRRPGQERIFTPEQDEPIVLAPDSPALHLIQRVRDEAHRFAILGHRRRRARRHSESSLEAIPGLGPARRRELLKQFGGLQGILRAGVDDLAQVRGIGKPLAQLIYEHLHPGA